MGDFIVNNIGLVALFVASGAMLFWPEIQRLAVGGDQLGTLDVTRLMNQGGTLVLDIREGEDFAAGHLPRARHIPLSQLSNRVEEIGKFKDKTVIVTCRTGARAGSASRLLRKAGFTAVYQLKGGLAAW
jgi:rhodanese-related sulfurtransferase